MRFAAALSTLSASDQAVDEVCAATLAELGATPDLAVLFVSREHLPHCAAIVATVQRRTGARALIGCSGESIVGTAREIEDAPAISLWLASLPGARVEPLRLGFERTAEGGAFVGWPEDLPARLPESSALLLLGEPFSFPADVFLERFNEEQPRVAVLGGMASGSHSPGENCVFLGDQVFDEGAVGVWLDGPLRVRSVVSQGCRPVGRHFVVTQSERNILYQLSGRPALERLSEVFGELSEHEQALVRQGVHVGRVINEYQDAFRRGDFLVRNVIGADPQIGAIALGDYVRTGQTVQFHIRDAQTADEDLRELLAGLERQPAGSRGALLFTCNGRGTRLFDEPNHDAGVLAEQLGSLPVAGFFAQGEIGPIGQKNFLHGFTASVAVFEEKA